MILRPQLHPVIWLLIAGGAGLIGGIMMASGGRDASSVIGFLLGAVLIILVWIAIVLNRLTLEHRVTHDAEADAASLPFVIAKRCTYCGFWVQGLRRTSCPECNASIPSASLVQPEDVRRCPYCTAPVSRFTQRCPWCASDIGGGLCPVCRYQLRGVRGPNCPECGTRLGDDATDSP